MTPPITTVPPSLITTWASNDWVSSAGMPCTRGMPALIAVFSTRTIIEMVPSAVICGVTSSFSTASMNCTEMVLLIVVCTGIFVPCFTTAFSLFWVMTLGLESSLPTPLDSAAEMIKSTAKFGDRWAKLMPLVGAAAGRLVLKGSDVVADVTKGGGGMPVPLLIGLVKPGAPTKPPNRVRPWVAVVAKPNCVPMSRAKEREAETTRARSEERRVGKQDGLRIGV